MNENLSRILTDKIYQHLENAKIQLTDISGGCGTSFDLIVISDQFQDKPLIQRHRLINEIIKDELPNIHALSLKTYTTKESLLKNVQLK